MGTGIAAAEGPEMPPDVRTDWRGRSEMSELILDRGRPAEGLQKRMEEGVRGERWRQEGPPQPKQRWRPGQALAQARGRKGSCGRGGPAHRALPPISLWMGRNHRLWLGARRGHVYSHWGCRHGSRAPWVHS